MTVKIDFIKANEDGDEDGDEYFTYKNVVAVLFDITNHKKLLRVVLDNGKIEYINRINNIKNMEVWLIKRRLKMTVKIDFIKANEDGDKYFMYENIVAVLFDITNHKKLLRVVLANGEIVYINANNIKNMEVR